MIEMLALLASPLAGALVLALYGGALIVTPRLVKKSP